MLYVDGYNDLANAIVIQAIEDYLHEVCRLRKLNERLEKEKKKFNKIKNASITKLNDDELMERLDTIVKAAHACRGVLKKKNNCLSEIDDLKNFFNGQWCQELTDLDGPTLLKQSDEFAEENGYNYKRIMSILKASRE